MEIKKSLLNAMLVGLTVVGVSSCGMFDRIDDDTKLIDRAQLGVTDVDGDRCWENCRGCGLG